jgi:hypothetical protein
MLSSIDSTPPVAAYVPEVVLPNLPALIENPHAERPIVQFGSNRVVQGWVGIFQRVGAVYWSEEYLEKNTTEALIANVSHNVIDYGGDVVGWRVTLLGNESQQSLRYRVPDPEAEHAAITANLPAAQAW